MPPAETITSAANPLVKDVRRAIARGGLTNDGLCVAETVHLIEEALRSGCEVKAILAAESAQAQVRRAGRIKMVVLPDPLFQSIAATETSQGVIALVNPPVWRIEHLFGSRALVVLLDGVQDPGNAGAIVRAAEAFGATGVLFLKGTAGPYNPKTMRASAGSLFRVPFLYGLEPELARNVLQAQGLALYAAVPARPGAAARQPAGADFTEACGIIIGNEARGVSGTLRGAAMALSIPTAGVESLNAAVAAGILLYEARRQRTAQS